MSDDELLGNWGLVRKRLQGVITEPVPEAFYNRITGRMVDSVLPPHVSETGRLGKSGMFSSEARFRDEEIEPVLKGWGVDYRREYRCVFHVGSQSIKGRVDLLTGSPENPLTLIETKLRITYDLELEAAVAQARSYALMLGLASLIVASPEAVWVYSLQRNRETLEMCIPLEDLADSQGWILDKICSLQTT